MRKLLLVYGKSQACTKLLNCTWSIHAPCFLDWHLVFCVLDKIMKLTKYKVKVGYLSYKMLFVDSCRIWRGDIVEKIPDPRYFFSAMLANLLFTFSFFFINKWKNWSEQVKQINRIIVFTIWRFPIFSVHRNIRYKKPPNCLLLEFATYIMKISCSPWFFWVNAKGFDQSIN